MWLLKPWIWPTSFVLCLLPLAWLAWCALSDQLGANPAEALIRSTGDWTLRSLCLTLAVTPLRQAFGWSGLARLRRMLGLFTVAYGALHFLCFAWLDADFDATAIGHDIVTRPFILVGLVVLLSMAPLAATSFNRAIRALGAKRWQKLHRTVYATAVLALLHFFWIRGGKNDTAEVFVYAAIVAALLGWRLWRTLHNKQVN